MASGRGAYVGANDLGGRMYTGRWIANAFSKCGGDSRSRLRRDPNGKSATGRKHSSVNNELVE